MSANALRCLLLFMIALFLVSSGQANCETPVSLNEEDSGSSVMLRQGQQLNVSLYGNGSTGYTWDVLPGGEAILEQGERQFNPDCPPNEPVVCGGTYTFTFMTIKTGQVPLKLIYHRRWETGVAPLRTFEVTVIVGPDVAVPTLTEWGMLIFALFAGLSSVYSLRRRQMSQV